ncbi:hypothetical protein CWC12_10535 [Pseudoalteromonas ruthenica]|nr:hypothetical protein CWC12_10535 [Pseudoalteromonas ruthenica]TMP21511.1 hypothetical protein CWC06_18360 [Pseudoalteromonas ruthenica]
MTSEDQMSGYIKVYFEKEIQGFGSVTVVGYIGEGATMSLTSHWNPPFLNDSVGDATALNKAADIAQASTGLTSKAEWNTILNWEGIEPLAFSLPVYFKAHSDAKKQVEDPIMFLEMMETPSLNEASPLGDVPETLILDIGRRIKITNAVILDVQSELDSPRTRDGYRTENMVTLQLQAKQMASQSDLSSIHI